MKNYASKQELITAIQNSFNKYLLEFNEISENEKNTTIEGVDKTPSQNISYQLGWVGLLLEWEIMEKAGKHVITPKEGFKWNNLGVLNQGFYLQYDQYSLNEMQNILSASTKVNL